MSKEQRDALKSFPPINRCDQCNGLGWQWAGKQVKCSACNGAGVAEAPRKVKDE